MGILVNLPLTAVMSEDPGDCEVASTGAAVEPTMGGVLLPSWQYYRLNEARVRIEGHPADGAER